MPTRWNLTRGAIDGIMTGRQFKRPLLQVLSLKKVIGDQSTERYRLLLSDGERSTWSAMLTTELNDKVTSGQLDINAIIRLDKYICNAIEPEKSVLILIEVTVLASGAKVGHKIGNPVPRSAVVGPENNVASAVCMQEDVNIQSSNLAAKWNLTHGAIDGIMTGKQYERPLLQVLGQRKVIDDLSASPERYRFLLSDGEHTDSSAMLSTKLNEKVTSDQLDTNAIIRLDKYVCNAIEPDKSMLILFEITVLASGTEVGHKIGNPVPRPKEVKAVCTQEENISSSNIAAKWNLTSGAIHGIMTGQEYERPLLQVLGQRKLICDASQGRYRLLLSDGEHTDSSAMLSPKLNDKITSAQLDTNAIIRLDKYICKATEPDKSMLILFEITILASGTEVGHKIGNPVPRPEVVKAVCTQEEDNIWSSNIAAKWNLTSGAIEGIMTGQQYERPLLQVLGVRKLTGDHSPERYRLLLSDGEHTDSSAMLCPKLNDKVTSGQLGTNAIIRLDKYICNAIQPDKRVWILLEVTVLASGSEVGHKIGNPVPRPEVVGAENNAASAVHKQEEINVQSSNMAARWNLTSGAIEGIMTGQQYERPLLQVLGVRKLSGDHSPERYRLLLSDGEHTDSSAMLSPKLNDKVTSGQLGTNAIIRLDKYICNAIQPDKRVWILLEVTVLASGSEVGQKIGNPVPRPEVVGAENNAASAVRKQEEINVQSSNMAARWNLTSGAIEGIMAGQQYERPLLQVLDLKKVISDQSTSPQRYRVLLSDGEHSNSSAMFSTKLHVKVTSGELDTNAIIRLDKYICCVIDPDKRVLILLEVTVLASGVEVGHKIGNPVPRPEVIGTENNAAVAVCKQEQANIPSSNKTVVSGNCSDINRNTGPAAVSNSSSGFRIETNRRNSKGFFASNRKPRYIALKSKFEGCDSSDVDTLLDIRLIANLTPFQNRWTIRALVTRKSAIRSSSNSRDKGSLFDITLVDESGDITATAFKSDVDKFYNLMEVNQVYYIRKAVLKTSNKRCPSTSSGFEMTFTSETEVIPCDDELPTTFNFVPINQLERFKANDIIDVIGVVKVAEDAGSVLMRDTNKEHKFTDVIFVDETEAQVRLGFWGDDDAEAFDGNPVFAMRNCRVADAGKGRALSAMRNSLIILNPDISEGHRLRKWFANAGRFMEYKREGGSGASSSGANSNGKAYAEAKSRSLGPEKADHFTTTLLFATKENSMYQACPKTYCDNKVVDQGNGSYRCDNCQKDYPDCRWRMIISGSSCLVPPPPAPADWAKALSKLKISGAKKEPGMTPTGDVHNGGTAESTKSRVTNGLKAKVLDKSKVEKGPSDKTKSKATDSKAGKETSIEKELKDKQESDASQNLKAEESDSRKKATASKESATKLESKAADEIDSREKTKPTKKSVSKKKAKATDESDYREKAKVVEKSSAGQELKCNKESSSEKATNVAGNKSDVGKEENNQEEKESGRPSWKNVRTCTTCGVQEPAPKVFKKCKRCIDEGRPDPPYYCGRDCQAVIATNGDDGELLSDSETECNSITTRSESA